MILRPPPTLDELPDTSEQFLQWLGEATAFRVPGRDPSRCRGFVTLLHGNEPSGLGALMEWLRAGEPPAVDLLCVIGAVDAARREPVFSERLFMLLCGVSLMLSKTILRENLIIRIKDSIPRDFCHNRSTSNRGNQCISLRNGVKGIRQT